MKTNAITIRPDRLELPLAPVADAFAIGTRSFS